MAETARFQTTPVKEAILSLSGNTLTSKAKLRLRSSSKEGIYIRFLLNREGFRLVDIQRNLSITSGTISLVVSGRRRSARVEAEIARLLGKASWNDVVSEARAATREFAPAVSRSTARTKRRAS